MSWPVEAASSITRCRCNTYTTVESYGSLFFTEERLAKLTYSY